MNTELLRAPESACVDVGQLRLGTQAAWAAAQRAPLVPAFKVLEARLAGAGAQVDALKQTLEQGAGCAKSVFASPMARVPQESYDSPCPQGESRTWHNGFGFNCNFYRAFGWCADGKFASGMEWTGAPGWYPDGKAWLKLHQGWMARSKGASCGIFCEIFRNPAKHCCACGKGALPTTKVDGKAK